MFHSSNTSPISAGVPAVRCGLLQGREGCGDRTSEIAEFNVSLYHAAENERYNEPVVRGVVAQLRELRHARNLSQKQVFTDTDINIGRIESGRGNISVSTLADLCAYYGIPLREFFERLEAGIASGE